MKRIVKKLYLVSLVFGGVFAWAIAAEMNFLPRLGSSDWWRWQVSLLAGLVFWVTGDRLAEIRCRCCGAREVLLRALVTRSHELLCHRCLRWHPELSAPTAPPACLLPLAVRNGFAFSQYGAQSSPNTL